MKGRNKGQGEASQPKYKLRFLEPAQAVEYRIYRSPRMDLTPLMQYNVWENITIEEILRIRDTLDDSPEMLFTEIQKVKEEKRSNPLTPTPPPKKEEPTPK